MLINIYDIAGSMHSFLGKEKGKDDFILSKQSRMSDLLIYPAKENTSNKTPYLQDNFNPCIEDFRTSGMHFCYKNSYFLNDILSGVMSREDVRHLKDYFYYLNGLNENGHISADSNIIIIPDDYDGIKQENILRYCGFARHKTFLLWHSVAVCLGAEELLRQKGAKEDDRVAVFNTKDGILDVSILTLKQADGYLVPCRKVFSNKNGFYPMWNEKMHNYAAFAGIDEESVAFWRHTYKRTGEFPVPSNGEWEIKCFDNSDSGEFSFTEELSLFADFYIIAGKGIITDSYWVPSNKTILADQSNPGMLASQGAGRFSVRQVNDLPTYFDQCEDLVFITQDPKLEKIVPKILIHGDEFCRGGTRLIGEVNKDFFIESENSHADFLLNVGEVGPNTPLKELIQDFGRETFMRQPLVLYPSMIPGQGVAQIEVEASPLLDERVLLDFSEMETAFIKDKYGNKTNRYKTINVLEDSIKRSFPIDIPEVEADRSLWDDYAVRNYAVMGNLSDSGLFAKSQWPNSDCSGIERFKRINVFGSNPLNRCPKGISKDFLERLFRRIANDYSRTKSDDYIRLAAWTYQKDNPIFSKMISETLDKMCAHSNGYYGYKLRPQRYTLCANMLSHEQQTEFFGYFNNNVRHRLDKRGRDEDITGVDNWLRALSEILMYNSDALKDVKSDDCHICANFLDSILDLYIKHDKNVKYVKIVIKCLLFLLKRRKYDSDFLKDENDIVRRCIMVQCKDAAEVEDYSNIRELCYSLIDFIEGNGTLEGIPIGDD